MRVRLLLLDEPGQLAENLDRAHDTDRLPVSLDGEQPETEMKIYL